MSLHNPIDLYEAWNKPEQAEEWRTKLPQKEAKNERHNLRKVITFKS